MQCFFVRRLKTPTEDTWKGVSELPHYSVIVFPRYEHDHLDNLLSSYVDPIGIAVIRVCLMIYRSFLCSLSSVCYLLCRDWSYASLLKFKMKHQRCEKSEN